MTAVQSNDVTADLIDKSHAKRVSFGKELPQTYVYETTPAGPLIQTVVREESLSKVTVVASRSELPLPINPPSSVNATDASDSRAPTGVVVNSPPLPSLQKMENETVENPFRPDGELSHVVDPIVEAYRHRPFPDPLVNGDTVDAAHVELQQAAPPPSVQLQEAPVLAKKAAPVESSAPPPVDGQTVELQRHTVAPPKAGKVELVHLEEKKRKCGCCVLQ